MKQRFILYFFVCFMALGSASCDQLIKQYKELTANSNSKSKPKEKKQFKDGTFKTYHKNKKLKAEITYKDGRKDGLSKRYYETGKLKLEVEYKDNRKHGVYKRYYKDGQLQMQYTFENNIKHGPFKEYYEDGTLMAEGNYHMGFVCLGMKEYLKSGKLKTQYPEIEVEEINQVALDGTFKLKVNLSLNRRKMKFFIAEMKDSECFDLDKIEIMPLRYDKGEGFLEFKVPPGLSLMKKLDILVHYRTIKGNYRLDRRRYNLAVDNF